jgi:hypothetical protein
MFSGTAEVINISSKKFLFYLLLELFFFIDALFLEQSLPIRTNVKPCAITNFPTTDINA